AAAHLAGRRLALRAGRGRARQHAVLRGDPSLVLAAQERGHAVLDRGGADHARVADLDEDGAFGVQLEVGRDAREAQVAGRTVIGSSPEGEQGTTKRAERW